MRTTVLALLWSGCFVCLGGCGYFSDGTSNTGRVAVIDLDAVAKKLGHDVRMANSIKQRETSLNRQLADVQQSYQKQLGDKKQELGEEPSQEQTQQLLQLQRQANLQLNQVRRQAQANLNQHRAQLIGQFRDETKTVARDVASEKGLSIIVTKNDTVVFAYEAAVDITDEVASRMLAVKPKPASQPSQAANATAVRPTPATQQR